MKYRKIIAKYKRQEILKMIDFINIEGNKIDIVKKFLNKEELQYNIRKENYKEFAGPFFEGDAYLLSACEEAVLLANEINLDHGVRREEATLRMVKEDFNLLINDKFFVEEIKIIIRDYIHPMGTVVRLKDASRNDKLSEYAYMITDRFVLKDEMSKEYYEYKANVYPIGSLPGGKGIMFNKEDIGRIEFEGYETLMDMNLVKDIQEKLAEKGIKKIENSSK